MASTSSLDQNKLAEIRNRVEAVLFAGGDKMDLEQISRMARVYESDYVLEALKLLEKDYGEKTSSFHLVNEDNKWKFHVKSKYLNIAKRLGVKTEMSKTIIETLAVVAWKVPVKQSDVIAIRTNKAYDHLAELEKAGFITRQRYGKTKLIKLGKRFFDYFEIDEHMMKKLVDRAAKRAEEMEAQKEAEQEVETAEAEKSQVEDGEQETEKPKENIVPAVEEPESPEEPIEEEPGEAAEPEDPEKKGE
ncbi:MAG: SMC-Scp complex subunit ScpB [Nanoarchaeota archaeon]|nr:SMC-Scp complex subunit ScpB [Nanoarchaeota archaeon]